MILRVMRIEYKKLSYGLKTGRQLHEEEEDFA